MRRVLAAAVLFTLLAAPASAAVPAGVRAKARSAASVYVRRFGIGYPPASWRAVCRRIAPQRPATWSCAMRTTTGQCKGKLRIVRLATGRLVARRIAIGCGE